MKKHSAYSNLQNSWQKRRRGEIAQSRGGLWPPNALSHPMDGPREDADRLTPVRDGNAAMRNLHP